MSKKDLYKLLSLLVGLNNSTYIDFNEIIYDEKINDCLSELYFSMLCDIAGKKDEHYNKFEKLYKDLNEEQQELIKKEIAKILDIEYKPKIKKKER